MISPSTFCAPLIAIVGPTAVGKSSLGLRLARRFRGEFINADSRQVYRGMDIGTAKPSPEDRANIPHHLLDVAEPSEGFNLARFQALAQQAIQEVHSRGKLSILVGGTGQYLWALLEGWQAPRVPPDPVLRRELQEIARRDGPQVLHQRLCEVDPQASERIHPHNTRRVIRALEVTSALGVPFSQARNKRPSPHPALVLGLNTPSRAELYHRIDARIDAMLASGWLEEVQQLLDRGNSPDLPALSSMGYRELALHIRGEQPLAEAVRRIRAAHRRLARHQYTWFKPSDPRIRWVSADEEGYDQAAAMVAEFMNGIHQSTGRDVVKTRSCYRGG